MAKPQRVPVGHPAYHPLELALNGLSLAITAAEKVTLPDNIRLNIEAAYDTIHALIHEPDADERVH